MLRDADDVRKVDGKFTTGWQIVQIATFVLFGVLLLGIFLGNLWLIWGAFAVLFVMATIARIVRGRLRKQQRLLRGMDPNATKLHFTAEEVEALQTKKPQPVNRLRRR